MKGHRSQRVGDALQLCLSEIFLTELKDPRTKLVTVSRVEVSSDLSHARVWVSALGSEDERLEAVDALRRASGFVRRTLAPRLRLRHVPELRFDLDRGPEHSQRINDLLATLEPAPHDDTHDDEHHDEHHDEHRNKHDDERAP